MCQITVDYYCVLALEICGHSNKEPKNLMLLTDLIFYYPKDMEHKLHKLNKCLGVPLSTKGAMLES